MIVVLRLINLLVFIFVFHVGNLSYILDIIFKRKRNNYFKHIVVVDNNYKFNQNHFVIHIKIIKVK